MTLTPGSGKQKKVEMKERRKQAHHWSPFLCYSFSMNISFILGISSSPKKTAKNDMKLNMFFEAVQKIWKVSKLESYAKSPCASGILGLKMSSCPGIPFRSRRARQWGARGPSGGSNWRRGDLFVHFVLFFLYEMIQFH